MVVVVEEEDHRGTGRLEGSGRGGDGGAWWNECKCIHIHVSTRSTTRSNELLAAACCFQEERKLSTANDVLEHVQAKYLNPPNCTITGLVDDDATRPCVIAGCMGHRQGL